MKIICGLLLLTCLGCGQRSSSPSESMAEPQAASTTGAEATARADDLPGCCQDCPLALPGVTLSFAMSTGGGSMMFTAPEDELEELRRRVRDLARYHNNHSQQLAMMTIPHQAEQVDIAGGAQLRMTTQINNDVPKLQTEIEQEVQWMRGGRCPVANRESCMCQPGQTPPLASSQASESELAPRPQRTSPPAQEP